MESIDELVRQRGTVKSKMTRLLNFINKCQVDDVGQLECRQASIPNIVEQFEKIQFKIENLVAEKEEEAKIHENYRIEFEDQYYNTLSKYNNKINALKTKPQTNKPDIITKPVFANLPKIVLPVFDGNYQSWPEFFDSFNTLVHKVESVPKITKFQYLKSSLKNEAANLIESLNISEVNYDIAIELLRERYDNKRIIVQSHITSIFNLPKIESANSVAIRNLQYSVNKHLRALKALNEPTESWGSLLIYIICSKLDKQTLKKWEESFSGTDVPTFDNFISFINTTANSLEGYELKSKLFTPQTVSDKLRNQKTKDERNKHCFLTHNNNNSLITCQLCKEQHRIFACETFLKQSPTERNETVKKLNLCFNCLAKGHSIKDCKSSLCKVCDKKHNTLLHKTPPAIKNVQEESFIPKSIMPTKADSSTSLFTSNKNIKKHSLVLLSTCIVQIEDKYGNLHFCRGILDCGSQLSFITKDLCNKLKLEKHESSVSVKGINNSNSHTKHFVNTKIHSTKSNFNTSIELHVLLKISNLIPLQDAQFNELNIPHKIHNQLADPRFYESAPVDILIGAEIFFQLLKPEQINPTNNITFQNTEFGWIVAGKFTPDTPTTVNNFLITNFDSIEETNDFKNHKITPEEQSCVQIFEETIKRDPSGRFVAKLPFKNNPEILEDNLNNAIRRFHSLEERLSSQPQVHEQYINFMREYLALKHMQEIHIDDLHKQIKYYIPHHPVFKQSLTTQIRVVFDATCKPPNGISLNSILMKGPVIQNDLFSIILRFRMHKYVLTADIAKMYRQILIDQEQVDFQRIIWRETPNDELKHYQLLTLTYGTIPASFIATKCLSRLARDYTNEFPSASHVIENDFYMDDLMTGCDEYDSLKSIQTDVTKILQSGCFTLRKWCSNSREILKEIPSDTEDPHYIVDLGTSECIKTLGLIWKPFLDIFKFKIESVQHPYAVSRRIILSELSKIFDPLGFLTPVIVKGKIFIQQLWLNNLRWDDLLPNELAVKWANFFNQLSLLEEFQISRRAKYSTKFELHGFCDASENAYAACVYVRSSIENDFNVHLLCAKSRVSPLKKRTIPELELNGAQLLTQLMLKVTEALHIDSKICYYWTDSSIVLAWLNGNPHQWKTYVSNRVSFIQENTTISKWRHIQSEQNPSDIASRGADVKCFLSSSLWFSGPEWLALSESNWPPNNINIKLSELPQAKPIHYSLINSCLNEQDFNLLTKYSSWSKLIRVMAFILRFIRNLRVKKDERINGSLKVHEYDSSKSKIYQLIQNSAFEKEIVALKLGAQLNKRSKIRNLNPFLDKEGIIRIGGRLKNSALPLNQINTIILPYSHVSKILFRHFHDIYLHAGPQNLLAAVRQSYWPLRGKIIAKQICKQCITCFKNAPKNKPPLMGQLPKERVNISRPFSTTGIDFAGPISIKSGVRKSTRVTKAYICIFVCFVTRAIHLEVVSDLTTDAFMASLRRFMSRRGVCSKIFSDNATNFVGAAKELKALFSKQNRHQTVPERLASEGIEWSFIPARSPHFGGIWEAGVKSVKYHLKRVIGSTVLNFEELYTVLSQIEAILNSRPLTPLSSSPEDLLPLTPAHFLVGDSLLLPDKQDFTNTPTNRLKRWQFVQAIMQHFWKRWVSEFLIQLQQRSKWLENNDGIKVGDVVLLDNSTLPPQQWILARITEVHPGPDGIVRVASVRTASNRRFTRAVNKLYPLPIEDNKQK